MSDPYDCYYDAQGCLVCPEVPPIESVAAHYVTQAVIGWNAGANSIDQLDDDLHMTFGQPLGVSGLVIGLKGTRLKNTLPALVENGFYFQSVAAFDVWQIIENGALLTDQIPRSESDTYEIRRVASVVTYYVNGHLVHTSVSPSYGVKLVNCCLYTSGDTAEGGTSSGGGGGAGCLPGDTPNTATLPGSGSTATSLGDLTTGVSSPIATDASANGDYTADPYMTWVATSSRATVTLTDPSGEFAAPDGWLLMAFGAPSSSNDTGETQWVGSKTEAPFVINVCDLTIGTTYYISLDVNVNLTDLSIEVTT